MGRSTKETSSTGTTTTSATGRSSGGDLGAGSAGGTGDLGAGSARGDDGSRGTEDGSSSHGEARAKTDGGATGAVSPDALRDGDGRGEPSIPLDAYIGHEEPKDSAVDEGLPDDAKVETTVAVTSIGLQTTSQGIQADSDLEEEVSIEETPGPPGDFQSLVKQVFRLYASGYSKGRFVFIRNPDLSRFMEDSKHILPGFRKRFRRFKRIFESLFDDTIQLQCDMPGQGLRITAGLTLDWFQVFVQKVVRRIGMEVMSFFAALLESQLY
ncbi:unnamed protein product [Durusdinium trenchii]|uniref:Uncharacterized protein n=1 Tax=Durusdinium trenchii TaxID=1381693 RepID=A0ABP0NFA4_9DINO